MLRNLDLSIAGFLFKFARPAYRGNTANFRLYCFVFMFTSSIRATYKAKLTQNAAQVFVRF